jgi:nitrogen fixation protein FixH
MKIKFNWGWKIAVLYSSFVCFMLFLGYMASREKVELVSNNYYEEELKYQDHIDKMALTDSLHVKPDWQVTGNKIAMSFPEKNGSESISGNIRFYCPSDEKRDFSMPFSTVPNKQLSVTSDKLRHGTYKMQIDWRQGKSDFYTEGIVTVQ